MKKIAKILVSNNIVKTNLVDPFRGTSGILLPVYGDCRELISLPEARKEVVNAFVKKIKQENIAHDFIAGTATGGIPWASFVAEKLDSPMLYVRGKPKGHGMGKMVEGRGQKGKHILIVEDMFSTAGSSIVSAEALRRELDANVTDILAVFSWDMPASHENSKKANVKLRPLTEFSEIVEALLEAGKITEDQKGELEKWHEDPQNWRK